MKTCVLSLIYNRERNQILLTKRRDVPVWVLPGGGVEQGESLENALHREVLEETGLTVSVIRKCGEYFPLNHLTSPTHIYECEAVGGKLRISDETSAVNFFPLPHLPKEFFEVHHDWLNDALKHPYTLTRKPIHQVTYGAIFKYFFKHPILVVRSLLSRIGLPINS